MLETVSTPTIATATDPNLPKAATCTTPKVYALMTMAATNAKHDTAVVPAIVKDSMPSIYDCMPSICDTKDYFSSDKDLARQQATKMRLPQQIFHARQQLPQQIPYARQVVPRSVSQNPPCIDQSIMFNAASSHLHCFLKQHDIKDKSTIHKRQESTKSAGQYLPWTSSQLMMSRHSPYTTGLLNTQGKKRRVGYRHDIHL